MAWTSIIEHGDTVQTPHGQGTVRSISESNGTAQVNVNGQLFEVPTAELKKTEGAPAPMPTPEDKPKKSVSRYTVKKGDRVERAADPSKKGTVQEVTQRSVKVKFDNGSTLNYSKTGVNKLLNEAEGDQPQPAPEKNTPLKKGDKVVAKQDDGLITKGMTGTVTQPGSPTNVKWDNFDKGHGEGRHEQWVGEDSIEKQDEKGQDEQPKQEDGENEQPETPEQVQEQQATDTANDLYGLFNLKKKLEEKIESEVEGEMSELRELAKRNQKLEVKVGDKVNVVPGLKHKQLEQLINYAALRLSPLLVGMAGTGKTHAGEQTALALGLDFYSMSVGAQTSKSDIIGYMAANGQYVSTHFRKAYEEGGVFLMDEIDAGNANVLIQINAALSNGLCAFPDKMVKRHEDFVFVASANTFGNGANRQYVGRNQLDAATLDRFSVIEWFIDDDLESNLTHGLNGKAWYMAVRAARDYVAEKNIRALISPRATQKGSKLLDVGQDLREVIHATMLGSVPEDKKADVEQVATSIFNKFASEVPGRLPKSINPEVKLEAKVDDLFKAPVEMPF